MSNVVDVDFANAVRMAANGTGDALAKILKSDAPIGRAEREMLADLVRGGFKPLPGKRPSMPFSEQRRIAVDYIERLEAGEASDAILADMTQRHGIKRSTILGWVAEIRKVEQQSPYTRDQIRADIKRSI